MKYFIHLPMKMEPIVSSETSEIKSQTPGNYPKRNKLTFSTSKLFESLFLHSHCIYCERSCLEYRVRRFHYIVLDSFCYQINNLIGGSIKLPSETLHDPLPVVFVEIRFGVGLAPFRHTLQYKYQY